ncbi:MAG: RNA polymerase sigma factor [Treponema sp.]|nr:RNA polymerase sigma factor [Treponema sp.]
MFSSSGPPGAEDIRRLYDSAAPVLVRIAVRITGSSESAEDVVQDAFARLIEKEIAFPSMDDAKFWLIRVVKNGALNFAKRKGREVKAYERWWRGERDQSGAADESVLKDESAEELRRGLEELPEKLKAVLVLKEYGGLNYKEIGRVLGISEGNVKVRAFRAREALLEKLGEDSKHVS